MQRKSIYMRYEPAVTAPAHKTEEAFWFVFYGSKLLVTYENDTCRVPYMKNPAQADLNIIRTLYLGQLEGKPCYSAELSSDDVTPAGMQFIELRSLYDFIEEDLFLLAGKAYQIVVWDQTHQFCGRCGSPTQDLQGERSKICPKCKFISYPRLCPAVITAVRKDNQILLAHAKHFKEGMYSLIAGFVEAGETLEEAVQREIMEEVGIRVKNIQYLGSQPWPFPNSMMLGFTAEYESGEILVDGVEITDANWYDKDNLPGLPSEVSIARKIIDWWRLNQS